MNKVHFRGTGSDYKEVFELACKIGFPRYDNSELKMELGNGAAYDGGWLCSGQVGDIVSKEEFIRQMYVHVGKTPMDPDKAKFIEEARSRGLVPGVDIISPIDRNVRRLQPYGRWKLLPGGLWEDGSSTIMYSDGRWATPVMDNVIRVGDVVDGQKEWRHSSRDYKASRIEGEKLWVKHYTGTEYGPFKLANFSKADKSGSDSTPAITNNMNNEQVSRPDRNKQGTDRTATAGRCSTGCKGIPGSKYHGYIARFAIGQKAKGIVPKGHSAQPGRIA